MILPIIKLATEIFCINHILQDLISDENFAVLIKMDHNFDFPTMRVDNGNMNDLYQAPIAYIVNLEETDIKMFLQIRRKIGFQDDTKYVFVGKEIQSSMISDFTPHLIRHSIFISTINKDIASNTSIEKADQFKSIKIISWQNCLNFTSEDLSVKMEKRNRTVKACLFFVQPYTFFDKTHKMIGIANDVFDLIVEMLNISLRITLIPFPSENYSARREEYLYNGTCDVQVGANVLHYPLEISYPFIFDSLHWIITTPAPKPRWKYVFEIFPFHIWMSLLFSSVCLSIFLFITSKAVYRTGDITRGLVMIFKHMIEQGQVFKLSNCSQNIVITVILITTFLVNRFYQSQFIFLMTSFSEGPIISSIEDLMEYNYKLAAPDTLFIIFKEDQRVITYARKNRILAITNLSRLTEDNVAVMYPRKMFLYEIKNNLDDQKRPRLKIIPRGMVNRAFGGSMRRGDPLIEPLNEKLMLLHDHGFISLIQMKYQFFGFPKDPPIKSKLTIKSLQLTFALWIIGITISIAIFFFEIHC